MVNAPFRQWGNIVGRVCGLVLKVGVWNRAKFVSYGVRPCLERQPSIHRPSRSGDAMPFGPLQLREAVVPFDSEFVFSHWFLSINSKRESAARKAPSGIGGGFGMRL